MNSLLSHLPIGLINQLMNLCGVLPCVPSMVALNTVLLSLLRSVANRYHTWYLVAATQQDSSVITTLLYASTKRGVGCGDMSSRAINHQSLNRVLSVHGF